MTNYCESLRQIGAAREEVPGRREILIHVYRSRLLREAGLVKGRRAFSIPHTYDAGDELRTPFLICPDTSQKGR